MPFFLSHTSLYFLLEHFCSSDVDISYCEGIQIQMVLEEYHILLWLLI